MGVFNYAAYAKTIELGIAKPNMKKIAKSLFQPIIVFPSVVNHVRILYTIDSKMAKDWYD